MAKQLSKWWIVLLAAAVVAAGCGDDDDEEPAQWSDWQEALEGDVPGKLVDGKTWEHYPTFKADTEREFRYWDISTAQPVDAFIAPEDNCVSSAAIESRSDIEELIVEDHADELSDGTDSGTPICVGFHAHLIDDGGSWYIGVEMRERPRSD